MYVRFRFKTERSVLDKDHLCTLQKIDLPCKKIGKVQTSVPCFDISHKDGPKEQHECTSSKNRDHQSSTFCLMYPSKTESLPSPLDISSVAQEISKNNITKKVSRLTTRSEDAFIPWTHSAAAATAAAVAAIFWWRWHGARLGGGDDQPQPATAAREAFEPFKSFRGDDSDSEVVGTGLRPMTPGPAAAAGRITCQPSDLKSQAIYSVLHGLPYRSVRAIQKFSRG